MSFILFSTGEILFVTLNLAQHNILVTTRLYGSSERKNNGKNNHVWRIFGNQEGLLFCKTFTTIINTANKNINPNTVYNIALK